MLTTLNLRGNVFGDEGAKALASALCVNAVLNTLDLHYNDIGDEGAKAIGKALAVNRGLTTSAALPPPRQPLPPHRLILAPMSAASWLSGSSLGGTARSYATRR